MDKNSKMQQQTISLNGISTSFRHGGAETAPTLVFLHAGTPGLSPYCGGSHLWGDAVSSLARDFRLLMPDLLGSGGTEAGDPAALSVQAMADHLASFLGSQSSQPVHLVGHDLGALVGFLCAENMPEKVASLSIVASPQVAPTGDGLSNLVVQNPPAPLWSRKSQAWVFERLSYSHLHVDDVLLDAAVSAAESAGHRAVMAHMRENGGYTAGMLAGIDMAKNRFFQTSREKGVSVPVQTLWGRNDQNIGLENGMWLHRILSEKQRFAQFNIINRAGTFLYRDQPREFGFHISSFVQAVIS